MPMNLPQTFEDTIEGGYKYRQDEKDPLDAKQVDHNFVITAQKLNELESSSGTTYVHPETHPASMIETDSNNRFVTDDEKEKWNNSISSLGGAGLLGLSGIYSNFVSCIDVGQRLIAIAQYDIIVSDDRGKSWVRTYTTTTPLMCGASIGNVVLVGTNSNILLKSEDSGATWKTIPFKTSYKIVFDDDTFYSIANTGVSVSSNYGETWVDKSAGFSVIGIAVVGGVVVCVGMNGGIATSTDKGKTWVTRTSTVTEQINGLFAIDGVLYACTSTTGIVLVSYDLGVNWTKYTIGTNITGVAKLNNVTLAVGSSGKVFSFNGGSWVSQTSGSTTNFKKINTVGNRAYASDDSSAITSVDGITWENVKRRVSWNCYVIKSIDGKPFVFGGNGEIYISKDGIDFGPAYKVISI